MLKPVVLYSLTVRDGDRYNPARQRLRDANGSPVDQVEALLLRPPTEAEVAGWICDNIGTPDATFHGADDDEPGWKNYRFNTGTFQDFAVKVVITADGRRNGFRVFVPEDVAESIYS